MTAFANLLSALVPWLLAVTLICSLFILVLRFVAEPFAAVGEDRARMRLCGFDDFGFAALAAFPALAAVSVANRAQRGRGLFSF